MAETGEPYSVARRAVISERGVDRADTGQSSPRWFALRYDANGLNGLTAFLDGMVSLGRPKSGVEVGPDEIRVRAPGFDQRIPRRSIRTACQWEGNLHGTSGVHVTRGQLLVNGRIERPGPTHGRSTLPHTSHDEHDVGATAGSRGSGQPPGSRRVS
jgi:hypothetical protein